MRCNEGKLMAYLDGQLSPRETAGVAEHVAKCDRCSRMLETLSAERAEVARVLEPYRATVEGSTRPAGGGKPSRPARSGAPVSGNVTNFSPGKGVSRIMKRYHKALAVAAAVAVIAGLFSIGPVRSFAAQFLRVFRVDQVEVVHFDPADVKELEKALQTYGRDVDIASFGEIQREENNVFDRLDPDTVRIAGQSVVLPRQLGPYPAAGDLKVVPGEKTSIKPRVDGINGFLASLGSSKLMPRSLDGKTFTIDVPPVASKPYRAGNTDVWLFRSVSPEFMVPEGVEVAQVREALLAIPILPERMRNTLAGIDPFGSTLMVPDFGQSQGGTVAEVAVNGTKGVFITPGSGSVGPRPSHSVLIWPQGTVWNALEGDFDLSKALDIAKHVE
ncbi:MAG: zf-HC2 domain-containing protein [Bacillota bacterium]